MQAAMNFGISPVSILIDHFRIQPFNRFISWRDFNAVGIGHSKSNFSAIRFQDLRIDPQISQIGKPSIILGMESHSMIRREAKTDIWINVFYRVQTMTKLVPAGCERRPPSFFPHQLFGHKSMLPDRRKIDFISEMANMPLLPAIVDYFNQAVCGHSSLLSFGCRQHAIRLMSDSFSRVNPKKYPLFQNNHFG